MKLYSTKNPNTFVGLEKAIFESLPADRGLYMPEKIKTLPKDFFQHIQNKSFQEISFEVAKNILGTSIPSSVLLQIVEEAINFPAPLKEIDQDLYVLELFHGPSMAFKDFGARFMSRLMNYFLQKKEREINILVATSGDTGGAVALGFYNIPGIKVTLLYPKGKVSALQEKQLTTLGKNITALEIDGNFDDCQSMVKSAFLDKDVIKSNNLSSANSINIARLIPQTFYYFNAYAQLKRVKPKNNPLIFSVPSGNFGNLTAGLLAWRMGLPADQFVASTNINAAVPEYLQTGVFSPRPSQPTLSNAMDIGDPSNFERMCDLFNNDFNKMQQQISGFSFTDLQTRETIKKVASQKDYILCPHTAVAYAGLQQYLQTRKQKLTGVFLSSAHPCKFSNAYDAEIWSKVKQPEKADKLMGKYKQVVSLPNNYAAFKNWLMR